VKVQSWEKLETLYCGEGEKASFCWKVPRLRPLVLLISKDIRMVGIETGGGGEQNYDFLN
jgi:hypothetical protein